MGCFIELRTIVALITSYRDLAASETSRVGSHGEVGEEMREAIVTQASEEVACPEQS